MPVIMKRAGRKAARQYYTVILDMVEQYSLIREPGIPAGGNESDLRKRMRHVLKCYKKNRNQRRWLHCCWRGLWAAAGVSCLSHLSGPQRYCKRSMRRPRKRSARSIVSMIRRRKNTQRRRPGRMSECMTARWKRTPALLPPHLTGQFIRTA